jgi:MscS family membrane protein
MKSNLAACTALAVALVGPRVAHADDAVAREAAGLATYFPEVLSRPGPHGVLYGHLLLLPVLALLGWAVGRGLGRLSCQLLGRLAARTKATWDDALVAALEGPLRLAWGAATFELGLMALGATPLASMLTVVHVLYSLALFWALFDLVEALGAQLSHSAAKDNNHASRPLIALGVRCAKVAVGALALVAVLSQMGYSVASLLAGLGVGGLAVALAAQKTVENLFGAFSLAADQPFREGDFVKIEDFVGTVEAVGLRSTRVRTLDRTVIAIPNGKLAEMRVESFSARDRMRLACDVGLVYRTTAAQLRAVLVGLEGVLRAHPKIWPDAVVVRFKELGASSLNIEVMAWFQTEDWSEFQLMRQDVLIAFMEVVERAGSDFAFPTRTVVMEPPLPSTPQEGS